MWLLINSIHDQVIHSHHHGNTPCTALIQPDDHLSRCTRVHFVKSQQIAFPSFCGPKGTKLEGTKLEGTKLEGTKLENGTKLQKGTKLEGPQVVLINPIAPERSTVAEQHTPNSYCSKLQVVCLNELRDILALGYIRPWAILGSQVPLTESGSISTQFFGTSFCKQTYREDHLGRAAEGKAT